MSGTAKQVELASAERMDMDLMTAHMNVPAVLGLIEKAFHDDEHDKLDERIRMLETLARRHRERHEVE